ncbi:MAG: hypothetical protein JWM15_517 [Cryptosporangiaceae bacterium]|nr:hypothetical protein [Cryptosporangiaceae bacterium]
MRRPGDPRPGRRLLGDRHDARVSLVDGRVDLLQERHRVEVLPATELVRQPLALLAGVVEVEHRGHRVDPEAVDVELLQPVQRVGDEEVADLGPAEVEHERAPVELLAAARVGVLVQRGAVELGERPRVLGEVGGHPVDDHPDVGPVQPVDEVPELVGGAEPRAGRVVGGDLVAPRAAERVLGHRQQLDMREAGLLQVLHQLVGEFHVAESGPPGAEVHLVRAHRRGVPLGRRAAGEPLGVGPGVVRRGHHGRGRRGVLGGERQRVRLLAPHPVGAEDAELVLRALADAGDEQLPHAGRPERAHRERAPVPVVEVAEHPDAPGVRRPHRERRPRHGAAGGVVGAQVGAERRPQLLVPALADQVQVDLAQRGQPAVRVVDHVLEAVVVGDADAVVADRALHGALEHAALVHPPQVGLGVTRAQHDGRGPGTQRPDHGPAGRCGMRPQDRVRVVVRARDQPVQLGARNGHGMVRHGVSSAAASAIRAIEASGIGSQLGRCRAS